MLDAALLIVFPALMVFAAFADLFTMTIPNRLSLILAGGFFILAAWVPMPLVTIGWHLLAGILVLVIGFTLFSFGWIGGGDAKLAAATALWIGFERLMDYAVLAAVIGGALTLLILQMRRWPLPSMLASKIWIARLHEKNNGVPYGIALAISGLILYPDTRVWLTANILS